MTKRVNLDAMIPRADFGEIGETKEDRVESFRLADLEDNAPILKSLRKPDFQRETNHWTPSQVAALIQSFVDDELVPSLILWDSETYMFVIDGGHRLSAIRAWVADDYGDGLITHKFYNGHISRDQKNVAKFTRTLVEARVGKFVSLRQLVAETSAPDPAQLKRANRMFRRPLDLQWVRGSKEVAEISFFKINSQGTPLDTVETSLIKNRRKPIAIAARSIIRAGEGHRYGSDFDEPTQATVSDLSAQLYKVLFEPEIDTPVKTLDIPLGGSVSPVDALALLVEFLEIAGREGTATKRIDGYDDDATGDITISILRRTLVVVQRMTTNSTGSLGLHPAVYYYSDKGKHSRFLFLGMTELIADRLSNNDPTFFKKFTIGREGIENFLIHHKSLISGLLQNLNNKVRVSKMRDLFAFLVTEYSADRTVDAEGALRALRIEGKVFDLSFATVSREFSDEVKAKTFVNRAITSAVLCPLCKGLLDPIRSMTYDHVKRKREGGLGNFENCDITHPFCNSGFKS